MTKRLFYILLGFSALIAGLWALSNWQALHWQNNFIKSTGFEPPENISYAPTENGSKEFTSPDGKLKVTYPANWLNVEGGEYLQTIAPQEWREKYDLQVLFLGQKFQKNTFAQIIIYQGNFDFPVSEIIQEMHNANRQQGWQVEIVDSAIDEKTGVFEARSVVPQNYTLRSKEKIIKTDEENTYLVSFIAPDKDWLEFAAEAEAVINSAAAAQ